MRRRKNPFEAWSEPLIRLAMTSITVLVLIQLLMLGDGPRSWLSRVDRLEGDPIFSAHFLTADNPRPIREVAATDMFRWSRQEHRLILKLIRPGEAPAVQVIVNGNVRGDFRRGQVELLVNDGDYIELVSEVAEPIAVVVRVPDGGILKPEDGLWLEGRGPTTVIGKVRFRP